MIDYEKEFEKKTGLEMGEWTPITSTELNKTIKYYNKYIEYLETLLAERDETIHHAQTRVLKHLGTIESLEGAMRKAIENEQDLYPMCRKKTEYILQAALDKKEEHNA